MLFFMQAFLFVHIWTLAFVIEARKKNNSHYDFVICNCLKSYISKILSNIYKKKKKDQS